MPQGDTGYNSQVPDKIREMIPILYDDVIRLHSVCDFYFSLFATEDNVGLMSEMALASFSIIEQSLRTDIVVTICRLADREKVSGHKTISFTAMQAECNTPGVEPLLTQFRDACASVKLYRNKHIGHNDREAKLEPAGEPIILLGKPTFDRILSLAGDLINTVYQHYTNSQLGVRAWQYGGADELLRCLSVARDKDNRDRNSA